MESSHRIVPSSAQALPHLLPESLRAQLALPVLVLSQFLALTLWFSGSAVLPALTRDWGLSQSDGGLLLSAVNAGFILGTLVLALFNLADKFSPSRVFLISALIGAGANWLFAEAATGLADGLAYRFVTGAALAGLYPVGMKLVVTWFPHRAGSALGWLVGALTLGSASPYLFRSLGAELPWHVVMAATSSLAAIAGLLVVALGDGPHSIPARKVDLRMIFRIFTIPGYRGAALGYFGHMWELYALWALSPLLVQAALTPLGLASPQWIALGAFAVIGLGALGCIGGGIVSRRAGSLKVAAVSLGISGALCIVSPLLLGFSPWLYLGALAVWGIFVVADSPQFSALSARTAPPEYVATALTVQNGIGFALTIASIELTTRAFTWLGPEVSWLLAPGPVLGLWLLLHRKNRGPA